MNKIAKIATPVLAAMATALVGVTNANAQYRQPPTFGQPVWSGYGPGYYGAPQRPPAYGQPVWPGYGPPPPMGPPSQFGGRYHYGAPQRPPAYGQPVWPGYYR
jgi:hypothetical protein